MHLLAIAAAAVLPSSLTLSAETPETKGPGPTFSHDVAPILYQHCVQCHHPNDIAPMSLLTYSEVRPWAAAIREAVISGKMPPWKADPAYGHWSNDPRLSEAEVNTLKAWTAGAKFEGDPKEMPTRPEFPDGWKIGKPDVVLAIPEHHLDAKGPDEYTYVNVPTNFKEDRWIIAARKSQGRSSRSCLRRRPPRIDHQSHTGCQSGGRVCALDSYSRGFSRVGSH